MASSVDQFFSLIEGILVGFPPIDTAYRSLSDERASKEALFRRARYVRTELDARDLLDHGIICALQGETILAFRSLQNAAKTALYKPESYLQALVYGFQLLYMQYSWSLGNSTAPREEMDSLYNLEQAIPYWNAKINETKAHVLSKALTQLINLLSIQRQIVSFRAIIAPDEVESSQILEIVKGLHQKIQSIYDYSKNFRTFASLQLGISNLYHQLRHYQIAFLLVNNLLGQFSQINDKLGIANCEMKLGDFKSTSSGSPESWDMRLRPGAKGNASLQLSADNNSTVLDLDGARIHYLRAYSLFKSIGFGRGIAAINLRRGYINIAAKASNSSCVRRHTDALQFIRTAEEQYSTAGDIIAAHTCRAHVILCQVGIGQLPEDRKSAKAIGEWGRTKGSISFVFGIGLFFAHYGQRWVIEDGDYERALAAFRLSEALFEGLELPRPRVKSVMDQINIHELLGEQDRFVITAEHLLRLNKPLYKSESKLVATWARSRSGQVLNSMLQRAINRDDWKGIETAIQRMQDVYPESSNQSILENLATIASRMNMTEVTDPIEVEDIVSNSASQGSVRTGRFLAFIFHAREALKEGDWLKAEENWKYAEASALDPENEHKTELLLAGVFIARKQYQQAAQHLQAFFNLRVKAKESMSGHIERLLPNSTGEQSGTMGQMSNLVYDHTKTDYITVMRDYTMMKQFKEAGNILETLVQNHGSDWWKSSDEIENLSAIAEVKEGLGQFDLACQFYEKSMTLFERKRNLLSVDEHKLAISGNSTIQGIYFKACRAAVKWYNSLSWSASLRKYSTHLDEAFKNLERGKSRSLLDLMAVGTLMYHQPTVSAVPQWDEYKKKAAYLATRRGILAQVYLQKIHNKKTIEKLQNDISDAESRLSTLEKSLFAEKSPMARQFVTTAQIPDLRNLKSQINSNAAVLQYSYRENDLIAWSITSDGMTEVFCLSVDEIELERRVKQFREYCTGKKGDFRADEEWLANLLLPFKGAMTKSHLTFVPYRALHGLPFHALPWKGSPLLSTFSVSYLPSASSIAYFPPTREVGKSGSVLAIGNPSNMKHTDPLTDEVREYLRLQYAETESNYIASLRPGSKSLVGDHATKTAVSDELEKHEILHFATHASLSGEVPLMSAIALAHGEELTVSELIGRRLKASLVVLSACNTGTGQITNGDDIVGFSRALLAANVRSVVASFWSVDDLATSTIMARFYKHIGEGMPYSAALGKAQNFIRQSKQREVELYAVEIRSIRGERFQSPEVHRDVKDYGHPYYWAPFFVIGTD